MALQADGKVVIHPRGGVARLNADGTLDTTFISTNSGLYSNGVMAMGVQTNGGVILGGSLGGGDAYPNYLARLNPDGSLDRAFDARIGLATNVYVPGVSCLAMLPHDQIVIAGNFSEIDGYSRNGIARLNADGSLDQTFDPGLGPDGFIWGVAAQGDGKIIIIGGFGSFDGTKFPGIARLNHDGSLDHSFIPGAVPGGGQIFSVACQTDGKIVISGSFTQGIARLNGDAPVIVTPQLRGVSLDSGHFGAYLNGTVSNSYRVEWTSQLKTPSLWTPLFNVTLQSNPQFIVDPNPATGSQRFYRAVQIAP